MIVPYEGFGDQFTIALWILTALTKYDLHDALSCEGVDITGIVVYKYSLVQSERAI